MARTSSIETSSVSGTIFVTPAHRTIGSGKALVTHTLPVVADTVVGAGIRASVLGAIHTLPSKMALACSIDTVSVIRATIGTFLDRALGTSPSLETVASSVVALSIVVAVSWARPNRTIGPDPSRRAKTLSTETATSQRTIVGTQLVEMNDGTVVARVTRETSARSIVARSLPVAVIETLPRR